MVVMRLFLTILSAVIAVGSNQEYRPKILKRLHSPDSSLVIVQYSYENRVLGASQPQTTIMKPEDKLPQWGNLFRDAAPVIEWISFDTILVHVRPPIEHVRKWARASFNGITITYVNDNPPFQFSQDIYFSAANAIPPDTIEFQTGMRHFITYLEWNQKIKIPAMHLVPVEKDNRLQKILMSGKWVTHKYEEITEGRKVRIDYIPKYEFIPSWMNNKKLEALSKMIRRLQDYRVKSAPTRAI